GGLWRVGLPGDGRGRFLLRGGVVGSHPAGKIRNTPSETEDSVLMRLTPLSCPPLQLVFGAADHTGRTQRPGLWEGKVPSPARPSPAKGGHLASPPRPGAPPPAFRRLRSVPASLSLRSWSGLPVGQTPVAASVGVKPVIVLAPPATAA